MKRFAVLLAGLFVLTSGAPLEHVREPRVSAEMKAILRDRLFGRYDLKVDDLMKLRWTEKDLREAMKHIDFEVIKLPHQKGTFDTFKYRIFRSRSNNDYMIERTEGFAGVYELYARKKDGGRDRPSEEDQERGGFEVEGLGEGAELSEQTSHQLP